MRIILPIISATLLTACAHQLQQSAGQLSAEDAKARLIQAKTCFTDAKDKFVIAHPQSPAIWFLSDKDPTPSDFMNTSMASKVEAININTVWGDFLSCYAPVVKPTGYYRYDAVVSNFKYAFDRTSIEIGKYTNRQITRGEYLRQYVEIENDLNNNVSQKIDSAEKENTLQQAIVIQQPSNAPSPASQAGTAVGGWLHNMIVNGN
jgi:hypothetical protein